MSRTTSDVTSTGPYPWLLLSAGGAMYWLWAARGMWRNYASDPCNLDVFDDAGIAFLFWALVGAALAHVIAAVVGLREYSLRRGASVLALAAVSALFWASIATYARIQFRPHGDSSCVSAVPSDGGHLTTAWSGS